MRYPEMALDRGSASAQPSLIGAMCPVLAMAVIAILLRADAELFGPIRATERYADEVYSQNPGSEFSRGLGQNITLAVSGGQELGLPNPLEPFGVMICSTIEDLAEEREAADRAIQGLKLTRFRSGTFGSLSCTPLEVCALLAQQCSLFVLIIGRRYGSIIESQGISVVEFEYRVAREQNSHKILAFVKEPVEREPREKEFLQRVQNFEYGYFTSEFTTPEDRYEAIQCDVSRWLTSHVNLKKPQAQ